MRIKKLIFSRKTLLIIETVLLVSPSLLIAAWGSLMMLFAFAFLIINGSKFSIENRWDNILGIVAVLGGWFALIIFIIFVKKTIEEKKYYFGVGFWIAILMCSYTTYFINLWLGTLFTIIVIVPAIVLLVHFSYIQIKIFR